MAKFPVLKVDKREALGRKIKKLRREGILPGNIFGKKISSIAIQMDVKAFKKIYDEVGETGLVEVTIGDDKYHSLVAGLAVDHISGALLHVDFHHVSLKEKVTASIPVMLVGESSAIKNDGAVLAQNLHEIEVEALPTHLPEHIEIDLTKLAHMGDSISIADLKLGDDIEIKNEPETVIVSATEAKVEVEPEVAAEPVEVETIAKGKSEDNSEESK